MSIFKGFHCFYSVTEEGIVDLRKFNSFSELEKGSYLIKQYISLIELNSYRISLSNLYTNTNYVEQIYKNTSNLFVVEYCDTLDYYFKTWVNQLDTNIPINKTLLSIVQWLRGDINLNPSVKLSDLFFFINKGSLGCKNYTRNTYDNNTVLITFFYLSKIKNLFETYDSVNINTFEEVYPNKEQEKKEIIEGYLPLPLYNEEYSEYEESNFFFYTFGDEYIFKSTDVSYSNLILNKEKSIFDFIFCNSILKSVLDIRSISYFINRFDIGFTDEVNSDERSLISFKNLVYDEKKFVPCIAPCNDKKFLDLIKNLLDVGAIKQDSDSIVLMNIINVENNNKENKETISSESLNLLSKIDKLIYKVSMEDEDVDDENNKEEDEKEEDNIDDENMDDSETDDVSDESDEFDSGSSEGDDSSYDSSSGGSYGSTEKPPIEVPKNVNANTSSSKGIKLELDVNPTFDTVMVKRELSNLIDNLLIDEKLTPKQRVTLEGIKTKWMGLLTSESIIDWMERTLNRTIFKKS